MRSGMIDLHNHLLPGIDDGAPDLDTALAMARLAVADGIEVVACTPHIYPGLYENDSAGIGAAIAALSARLAAADIPLRLVAGADTHLTPDLVARLKQGVVPTLGGSRYLLLEPPHHVAPPRFEDAVFQLMTAGYVPIITHPERLSWIETHYPVFGRLVHAGAWMQLTAGSLTGRFGRRPMYWAQRMLDERQVHLLATDAHNLRQRAPRLAEGRDTAAARVGEQEATDMVLTRPRGILRNLEPGQLPALASAPAAVSSRVGFLRRWLRSA
jgi:protein-tyrosine phosphatase